MRVSNQTVLLALALFALNLYICHELFSIEYLRHMGSIEGAFIGISRYAMHHWRDLSGSRCGTAAFRTTILTRRCCT